MYTIGQTWSRPIKVGSPLVFIINQWQSTYNVSTDIVLKGTYNGLPTLTSPFHNGFFPQEAELIVINIPIPYCDIYIHHGKFKTFKAFVQPIQYWIYSFYKLNVM